jgi:hypothetical protein
MFDRMPGADISPAEVGTEAGGYRVSGSGTAVVRIRAWGYWPPDVVDAFVRDAAAVCRELTPSATLGIDAGELKPQGSEAQDALRAFFRSLAGLKFEKGTLFANNALTRMQLTRLLREAAVEGRLTFADSAK